MDFSEGNISHNFNINICTSERNIKNHNRMATEEIMPQPTKTDMAYISFVPYHKKTATAHTIKLPWPIIKLLWPM